MNIKDLGNDYKIISAPNMPKTGSAAPITNISQLGGDYQVQPTQAPDTASTPLLTNNPSSSFNNNLQTSLKDTAIGAGKSLIRGTRDVASTVQGLGKSFLGAFGADTSNMGIKSIDNSTPAGAQVNDQLQAKSTGEKIGGYLETAAEVGSGLAGGTAEELLAKGKSAYKTYKAGQEAKALENSIKNTMPYQDKGVRIEQLRGAMPESKPGTGGVTRTGNLGTSEAVPTEKDVEVGTTAHPLIGKTKDPLIRIQNVNQGISNASEATDKFLDSNPSKVNFEDIRNYVESNKPTQSLQKDPGAFETYNRVNENAIDTLYDTLKESAKNSGNFGSEGAIGRDIRQARIRIDQQIIKELGETTFGSPQYKGIRAAEINVRNTINRLNENILRYPNQLSEVNKMNDFISTAKGRGIEIDLKNPEVQAKLEQQFGLRKTPDSEIAAQKLANAHKTMENLFTARDNMIDRYQSSLGKNKIKEWIKANPGKSKLIGWSAGIIGADAGYNLLK